MRQGYPYHALDSDCPRALSDPHEGAQVVLQHASPPQGLNPHRGSLPPKPLLDFIASAAKVFVFDGIYAVAREPQIVV